VLVKLTGWIFDAEKDSLFANEGPFLGMIEDYSSILDSGFLIVTTKPAFRSRLIDTLQRVQDSGCLTHGDGLSLRGRLLHQASAYEGRVGRGQVFAFSEHLREESMFVSPALLNNVAFHLCLATMAPVRRVDVGRFRQRVTIYTDASCEPGPEGTIPVVMLCYIVWSDCGYVSGAFCRLSDETIRSFSSKDTYISHGEAFAILFCLLEEEAVLRGKSIIFFMDNLGVLSSLCKGSSAVDDYGCVIHAVLLNVARLSVRGWYEHVDSHANAADGGTRHSTVVADALGVVLVAKNSPEWPKDTLAAGPEQWLQWLNKQS
jgi:hypothetical protein